LRNSTEQKAGELS